MDFPKIEMPKDPHQDETDPTVVIERYISRYRLPDDAIDLDAWLKDGLAVYNLFILMKPAFFQMLEALGGKFEMSMDKANKDKLKSRIRFIPRRVEKDGHIVDETYTVIMEDRTNSADVNKDFVPIMEDIKING